MEFIKIYYTLINSWSHLEFYNIIVITIMAYSVIINIPCYIYHTSYIASYPILIIVSYHRMQCLGLYFQALYVLIPYGVERLYEKILLGFNEYL